MKTNYIFILLVLLGCFLSSCEDEVEPIVEIINTGQFDALKIKGNATIYVNSLQYEGNFGDIYLEGAEDDLEKIEIKNDNKELKIEIKGNNGFANVKIYLYTDDLKSVILESDSEVLLELNLHTDDIYFKTEGNSELEVEGICAERIETKREGSSYIHFSSSYNEPEDEDTVTIALDEVEGIFEYEDKFIVFTDDIILYAAIVVEECGDNNEYICVRDIISRYYPVREHIIKNEGSGEVDAFDMPTLDTEVKNEGSATARVFVWDDLELKGEGESRLFYRGTPSINSNLEGSAQLINRIVTM